MSIIIDDVHATCVYYPIFSNNFYGMACEHSACALPRRHRPRKFTACESRGAPGRPLDSLVV